MNLLLSFLVYRPDVGYVKNMSFLAGTILTYCNEPEAFICFANFVHQNFFIKLFFGHTNDIELRVSIFDSYFKEILPDLFVHFEALEIDTAFFLIDWMLTVFVKNVDFKIACRIWDNLILDGEIFLYKTGLAILFYFETKFLKQCHFQIKDQLSDMRGSLDEYKLFAIIEDQMLIDEDEFNREIKKQTWCTEKAKVLELAMELEQNQF